jgi:DNA-binding transcriptional regulator YhcF (GntR family)
MSIVIADDYFALDRTQGIPLGTQLAWRLRGLIANGKLPAGERVPSVRRLAEATGLNVNTVRSVYGRLEEQGYLTSEHGRGTFVAEEPPAPHDVEEVERLATALERKAREAGVNPREVATRLYAFTGRAEPASADQPAALEDPPADAPSADALTKQELRNQIEELEARLVHHPMPEPTEDTAALPSPRPAPGTVLSAEQLTEVRNELLARLERLETARDELVRELRRLDPERAGSDSTATTTERPAPPRTSPSLAGVRVRWVGGT